MAAVGILIVSIISLIFVVFVFKMIQFIRFGYTEGDFTLMRDCITLNASSEIINNGFSTVLIKRFFIIIEGNINPIPLKVFEIKKDIDTGHYKIILSNLHFEGDFKYVSLNSGGMISPLEVKCEFDKNFKYSPKIPDSQQINCKLILLTTPPPVISMFKKYLTKEKPFIAYQEYPIEI